MIFDFLKLTKANSGEWMLEYQEGNISSFMWLDEWTAQLILSAQRAAKNELRAEIKQCLVME
jgi:hypothetical protein